jgi:hypothetical protein
MCVKVAFSSCGDWGCLKRKCRGECVDFWKVVVAGYWKKYTVMSFTVCCAQILLEH